MWLQIDNDLEVCFVDFNEFDKNEGSAWHHTTLTHHSKMELNT